MARVEYAVSGRSKCRQCGLSICKGEVRAGEEATGDYGPYTKWFHVRCYSFSGTPYGMNQLRAPDRKMVRGALAAKTAPSRVDWSSSPTKTAAGDEVDEEYRDANDVPYGRCGALIVGCQYYDGVIHAGEMAALVREPHNPYDANAVRVDNLAGKQVGHLKRVFAAALAPLLDDESASAPRIEAVVEREPANIYSVQAVVQIYGLPEHRERVVLHLGSFGVGVDRPKAPSAPVYEASRQQQDLDSLFTQEDEEVDEAFAARIQARVTSELLPHQLRGVKWMVDRETTTGLPPLWERRTERGRVVFLNTATNTATPHPPTSVLGGILADAMGLGKTVQVLALAAFRGGRTLVACPTSLVAEWASEVQRHTSLSARAYVGPQRALGDEDILITSYATLVSEMLSKKRKASSLRDVEVDRFVLDEAHVARNPKTKTFEAVCAVRARHRWCCTGTPLVNKVEDIQALFAFLRQPPVDDATVFRRAVSRPIKDGDPAGLSRLRVLVRASTLRRGKRVLALPARTLETRLVELGPESRAAYDGLFARAGAAVRALGDGALAQYTNILECLTRLRQICSGGASLVPSYRLQEVTVTKEAATTVLSRLREALGGSPRFECAICLDDTPGDEAKCLRTCDHFYCASCASRLAETRACALCRRPFDRADVVSAADLQRAVDDAPTTDDEDVPPKLEAVVEAVKEQPPDVKIVIFSQFVATLAKLRRALERRAGRSAATYSGKITPQTRAKLVHAFQTQDTPQILLISLACGNQGLNLTRASVVFLLDPWWNASTEDQALDRVHRIGQTRSVTAVKFVAAKTVEQRILDLQEAKSLLAEATLAKLPPDELRQARLANLHRLFEPFGDKNDNVDDDDDDDLEEET